MKVRVVASGTTCDTFRIAALAADRGAPSAGRAGRPARNRTHSSACPWGLATDDWEFASASLSSAAKRAPRGVGARCGDLVHCHGVSTETPWIDQGRPYDAVVTSDVAGMAIPPPSRKGPSPSAT